jgi:hypothetical protein
MVAQVVSMVVASTVVTLSAVNIHVGNLRAVNILAGSLVAANIPLRSIVAASTVNAAAMAGIATEGERRRYALQLSGALCGELFSARPGLQC